MDSKKLAVLLFIFIGLTYHQVLAQPLNCQLVNSSDSSKCALCISGYFPQQDQTGCSNSIPQCTLYSGNNCTQCKNDFGVFNQSCVSNIPYCASYQSLSKCSQCHSELGYSLNSDGSACFNTIPNCQLYINNSMCKQCDLGYSLASDSSACYLAPVKNCFQVSSVDIYTCGQCNYSFYLTTQKNCEKCTVPNCSTCNSDGTCSQCVSNAYVVSKGVCECNQGFYKKQDFNIQNSNFSCQACSYKCASCFEYDICTSCSGNRRLDQKCECPSNQITDIATSNCISCQTGQYKLGNQCVKSCPSGYYENQQLGECTSCNSNSYNKKCSSFVTANLKYNKMLETLLEFSQNVNLVQGIKNINSCFEFQLMNQYADLSQLQMSITQQDSKNYKINFQQNEIYTETKVVFKSINQNCFQTQDGKLIDYQIFLNPDFTILSPQEDFLSSPQTYDRGMKITIFIFGAIAIFCSFFGIKISQTITIEAIQVVFCLYLIDLYIPFHLQSLFQAVDIFNFRILNYIMSGFDGMDLIKDNQIFNYVIKDQYLFGRFLQRGFQVCSFFYNGLTYIFLITIFYGIYLFLTNTFLAPYDYPLAKPKKEEQNLKNIQISKDKSVLEEKNEQKNLEFNIKSPQQNSLVISDTFQLKQNLQKENDKIFETNKYEKINYYLLQISLNMIKISYIPLSFAAGLQLKNFSQADQLNSLSFFCAIVTLLLIPYTCGYLVYRDIKKYTESIYESKQDLFEYNYKVSELNVRNALSKKNKMNLLQLYYPILQIFIYGVSVLLVTWLNDSADFLIYIIITMFILLLAVNMYSPFANFRANLIHFLSNLFILVILVGLLSMKNLYYSIEKSSTNSSKQDYFNSIQYVGIFLSIIMFIFALLTSLYQVFNSYQFFKNGLSNESIAVVYPLPITSPTKNAIMTFENLEDKNQIKSPQQEIQNVPIKNANSRKTSFLEIKKDKPNQLRRQSTLNHMQNYEQNAQQKQIFVAPRKSLQALKQIDINSQSASQSSINDQYSTNPSSIQIIELEDIQKLVRENKKMEQKLAVLEKKQEQLIKKLNHPSNKQSLQNSFSSLDQDVKSDEEEPRPKKKSQNQSIETIVEEDEYSIKKGNKGDRRKRQSQIIQQIPQTPPSLQRIQQMYTDAFHFADDIKIDQKNKVKEDRSSNLKQNKFDKKKSKTMVIEDDNRQIFNYTKKVENSNQKILKNQIDTPDQQISEKSSPSSSSSGEDDENDLNFWKNNRKEQLRANKQSRAQSLLLIKNV